LEVAVTTVLCIQPQYYAAASTAASAASCALCAEIKDCSRAYDRHSSVSHWY